MTKTKKTTAFVLGILVMSVLVFTMSLNFASAEFKACFHEGDRYTYCTHQDEIDLPYCNSLYCTCERTLCTPCFKEYDETRNCYVGGNSAICLKMPTDCSTSSGGGGTVELDVTPPELIVLSPEQDELYNSRRVYVNFSLNEIADVYYADLSLNPSRISWRRVCTKCLAGEISYAKIRSFREGENSLRFKAVDLRGNEAFVDVSFLVDSTKPRIYKTSPRTNYFADGTFEVQFKELNPEKLTLHYGTDEADVDLDDCYESMGKENCEIDVNLNKYNGETIQYYFEIEDVVGNTYSSRATSIKVDTDPPVIKNPNSFFEITNNRYVEFDIEIEEDNFYKVTYLDMNNPRARPLTLCTRLVDGHCLKKRSFTRGEYDLTIEISDKAGHSIGLPATFTIDY